VGERVEEVNGDKRILGITSKKVWILNRIDEILDAIARYRTEQYLIPVEWVEELAEHMREVKRDH
jgi:hypothetical protein